MSVPIRAAAFNLRVQAELRMEHRVERQERKQVQLLAEIIAKTASALFAILGLLALSSGGVTGVLLAIGLATATYDGWKISNNLSKKEVLVGFKVANAAKREGYLLSRGYLRFAIEKLTANTLWMKPAASWLAVRIP